MPDDSPTYTLAQIAAALGGQAATPAATPVPSPTTPPATVSPSPDVARRIEELERRLAAQGAAPQHATQPPQSPPGARHPADLLPPSNDPGAPQALPVWERPSDPFKWTEEDIARIYAIKGEREGRKMIRQKAEAFARNLRLQLKTR